MTCTVQVTLHRAHWRPELWACRTGAPPAGEPPQSECMHAGECLWGCRAALGRAPAKVPWSLHAMAWTNL